jgi:hypothetical protein
MIYTPESNTNVLSLKLNTRADCEKVINTIKAKEENTDCTILEVQK